MAFCPTPEQEEIIEGELRPQCVIACPGSGKTATAVRRLLKVRKVLGEARSYVALLSYSNVAVETFQREYDELARDIPGLSKRVLIETVDSFLTSYILRPHGARAMRARRQPFLVNGSEAFLAGFRIFDGKYPREIKYLSASITDDSTFEYAIRQDSTVVKVDEKAATAAIRRLGAVGAYTHELGRYWALMTLVEEPKLLDALARRFPHIIVDEAQDVGSLHGILLDALASAGSTMSLIGDPNQAIYEFAGADGSFLRRYEATSGVKSYSLTQNRRSIASIVDVANLVAGTAATANRLPGDRHSGAYYLKYDHKNVGASLALFEAVLATSGYDHGEAAVLCRGRPYVAKLTGATGDAGTGSTEHFAQAAIMRDRSGNVGAAFEYAVSGVMRLLDAPPAGLRSEIVSIAEGADAKVIRRLVWRFLRDSVGGLPPAIMKARTQWHPKLKANVENLLSCIEGATSQKRLPSWGNNLTTRDLLDAPLWEADLASTATSSVRVDTVHKVKGESIRVVMYLARTEDANALVHGTRTEEGRIGYVAATRAEELLILGIPTSAKAPVIAAIEAKGFKAWEC